MPSVFTFDVGTGELRWGTPATTYFGTGNLLEFTLFNITSGPGDTSVWSWNIDGIYAGWDFNFGGGHYLTVNTLGGIDPTAEPAGGLIATLDAPFLSQVDYVSGQEVQYSFNDDASGVTSGTQGFTEEFIEITGGVALAGGDPHILPIIGKKYDMPHTEDTFLMFSNQKEGDKKITVKSKCWFLPESKYMSKIEKLESNGYKERAEKYQNILSDATYFKYTEIVNGDSRVIIDMDNLNICSFTSLEDVNNFRLPESNFVNNDKITVSNIKHSNMGILRKKISRSTLERVVTIFDGERKIYLRLMKDSRNIIQRNGIRINLDIREGDRGALIRKDIEDTEFGEESSENKEKDQLTVELS